METWDFQLIHAWGTVKSVKINAETYKEALKIFIQENGKQFHDKIKEIQKTSKVFNATPKITLDIGFSFQTGEVKIGRIIYQSNNTNLLNLIKTIPTKKLEKELNKLIAKGPNKDEQQSINNEPSITISIFKELNSQQLQELIQKGEQQ